MLSKKTTKIVSIIMIAMMLTLTISNVCMAATEIGGVTIDPDTGDTDDVSDLGNRILGIVQVVAIIIAVIWLMVLGIKYITGSAEEKAEYKKTLLPYVIGAILIGAAPTVVSAIYKWGTSITLG